MYISYRSGISLNVKGVYKISFNKNRIIVFSYSQSARYQDYFIYLKQHE